MKGETVKDFLNPFKTVWFVWFDNVAVIGKGVRLSLAYCKYGDGIADIITWKRDNENPKIKMFFINRTSIFQNNCSEADFCFNLKCPLNRVELKNLRKYGFTSMEQLKNFSIVLNEILEKKLKGKLKEYPKNPSAICFERPICRIKKVKGGFR